MTTTSCPRDTDGDGDCGSRLCQEHGCQGKAGGPFQRGDIVRLPDGNEYEVLDVTEDATAGPDQLWYGVPGVSINVAHARLVYRPPTRAEVEVMRRVMGYLSELIADGDVNSGSDMANAFDEWLKVTGGDKR